MNSNFLLLYLGIETPVFELDGIILPAYSPDWGITWYAMIIDSKTGQSMPISEFELALLKSDILASTVHLL